MWRANRDSSPRDLFIRTLVVRYRKLMKVFCRLQENHQFFFHLEKNNYSRNLQFQGKIIHFSAAPETFIDEILHPVQEPI